MNNTGTDNVIPGYNNVIPGYNNVIPGYNNVIPGLTRDPFKTLKDERLRVTPAMTTMARNDESKARNDVNGHPGPDPGSGSSVCTDEGAATGKSTPYSRHQALPLT